MHLNFGFSAVQVLWTLTFAALLVLLVVLLGRDRARRFPFFTASMALMALRLLASRLLYGSMAPIVSSEILLALAAVAAIVALLVVVEMARRAFSSASRVAWIAATLVLRGRGRGGAGPVGPVACRENALRRLDPRCPAAGAVDRAKGRDCSPTCSLSNSASLWCFSAAASMPAGAATRSRLRSGSPPRRSRSWACAPSGR